MNLYAVLGALAVAAALFVGGYWKGAKDNEAGHTAAALTASEDARRLEQARARMQQGVDDAKDANHRRTAARLADALDRLRERPGRLPEPARAACQGATGAELSSRDAGVLERLAARAENLRIELHACQDREHGEVTPLPQ